MTFEEKFAAQGRKLDEVKVKIEETKGKIEDAVKTEYQQDRKQLESDITDLDAELDAMLERLDAAIDKRIEGVNDVLDAAQSMLDEDIAEFKSVIQEIKDESPISIEGDINAVSENIRLMKEQCDSKRNAVMLRTQMMVKTAKEKIAERAESLDKAAQEDYIADLLDYASGCAEMANAWTLEAEYAMTQAALEVDDYVQKYGV